MFRRLATVLTVAALPLAALVAGGAAAVGNAADASPAGTRPTTGPVGRYIPRPVLDDSQRRPPQAVVPTPVPHLDRRLQTVTTASVGVVLSGNLVQNSASVAAVGGRVLATASGRVSAVVPRTQLNALAARPGVTSVDAPVRAVATDTSEGVDKSGASAWQTAGQTGAGVKVAVVDVGFGDLANEVADGALPAGLTITGNHCADNGAGTVHGTAVAEIVHQMAPSAQLFLYCVDDEVGFQQSANDIIANGIKIASSSLGFPGDSRGDGTGSATATVTSVKKARQAGVLWIQSAGNEASDHWGGTFRDTNRNGAVDLNGTGINETDYLYLGASSEAVLTWDQWPTSLLGIRLVAYQYDASGTYLNTFSVTQPRTGTAQSPVLCVGNATPGCTPLGGAGYYEIEVDMPTGTPALRYDLTYWGDVSYNDLSCKTLSEDNTTCLTYNPGGPSQSLSQPADSPYALAVGAANTATSALEEFSSQGPTIDGRTKPDLTGWDAVASNEYPGGFYGTSAATPHVAGAAALVMAANPSLDAAQIQTFLESRAVPGSNPPNQVGHGRLTLGPTTGVVAPVGSTYVPLATPSRALDTRLTGGAIGGNSTRVLSLAGPAPTGATAVAINLTGTGGTSATYLSVYPNARPSSSNLNLDKAKATAAVFATVTLSSARTITIYNHAGSQQVTVDVLGYFVAGSTDPAASRFTPVTPVRLLDTRSSLGGHPGALTGGSAATVAAGANVPADATAAIVNVTAVNSPASGYLSVSPDGSHLSSTLNFSAGAVRANLAIAGLATGGVFHVWASNGPVNVVVDLVGYLSPSTGARYVPVPDPIRIADTRLGNGGRHGALTGASPSLVIDGAGIFGVPYSATALMLGVTAIPASSGYLTIYPSGLTPVPTTSALNFTAGTPTPNAAVATLSGAGDTTIKATASKTDVAVDLFGYFI